MSAINSTLGSVSSGYITSSTIRASILRVGGTTSEDIYFEDSGIHMYDGGGQCINITKSGYDILQFGISSGKVYVGNSDSYGDLELFAIGPNATISLTHYLNAMNLNFLHTGVLQLPNRSSNPTGVAGGICMVNNELKYWNGSAWVVAT